MTNFIPNSDVDIGYSYIGDLTQRKNDRLQFNNKIINSQSSEWKIGPVVRSTAIHCLNNLIAETPRVKLDF